MEDEQERLQRQGQLVKFAVLLVSLLLVVFVIAALRPFIFDALVPALFGWDEPSAPLPSPPPPTVTVPAGVALPTATTIPPSATRPPASPTAASAESAATPVPTTVPSATPPAEPTATAQTYTVQAGDTLANIAARFNVSLDSLAEANGITNVNRIVVGDVLVIPPSR